MQQEASEQRNTVLQQEIEMVRKELSNRRSSISAKASMNALFVDDSHTSCPSPLVSAASFSSQSIVASGSVSSIIPVVPIELYHSNGTFHQTISAEAIDIFSLDIFSSLYSQKKKSTQHLSSIVAVVKTNQIEMNLVSTHIHSMMLPLY